MTFPKKISLCLFLCSTFLIFTVALSSCSDQTGFHSNPQEDKKASETAQERIVKRSVELLREMENLYESLHLKEDIERPFLGTYYVMRESVKEAIKPRAQSGQYQSWSDRLRLVVEDALNSDGFFHNIETRNNRFVLHRIRTLAEELMKINKLDLFGHITAQKLLRLYEKIRLLIDSHSNNSHLRAAFTKTVQTPLGKALALAQEIGDRPDAHNAAKPIYCLIRNLYPILNKVQESDVDFYTVLDIQGSNERLGYYLQMSEEDCRNKEKGK